MFLLCVMWWLNLISICMAENIVVRIEINDQTMRVLRNPQVRIDDIISDLLDNGTIMGDIAEDGIYVSQFSMPKKDNFVLRVENDTGNTAFAEVTLDVITTGSASFFLRSTKDGLQLENKVPLQVHEENPKESMQAKERKVAQVREGSIQILFSIDATKRKLSAPQIRSKDSENWLNLLDDGSVEGDTVRDDIWTGILNIPASESVTIYMQDRQERIANIALSLPSAPGAEFHCVYTEYGISPIEKATGGSFVVQAMPQGEKVISSGDDKITLQVYIDDRLLRRLGKPQLILSQSSTQPIEFRDDGFFGDAEIQDKIWSISTTVFREEFVEISVVDEQGGEIVEQGKLTVFLPSTSESTVWLRSTETGIKLGSEPTQNTASTPSTSTTPGSVDKLAHVLWIVITLFVLGFTYVRTVVFRYWTEYIDPRMQKIDAMEQRLSIVHERSDVSPATDVPENQETAST